MLRYAAFTLLALVGLVTDPTPTKPYPPPTENTSMPRNGTLDIDLARVRRRLERAMLSSHYSYAWCRSQHWSSRAYSDYVNLEGEPARVHCDGLAQNIADHPERYVDDYDWWEEHH